MVKSPTARMSNDQRMPMFHTTWPKVQRPISPTDEFVQSLSHQDWSKTVIGNGKKAIASSNSAFKPVTSSRALGAKLAESDVAGRLKQLAPESRQEIVQIRVANKWSQQDLNQRCSFPPNTIREIEAGRLIPTIGQLNTLNRVLKTGLKLI